MDAAAALPGPKHGHPGRLHHLGPGHPGRRADPSLSLVPSFLGTETGSLGARLRIIQVRAYYDGHAEAGSIVIGHSLFLAVTWVIKGLLRAGIPMGPMILLTVRGRKSGEPRTTPVDLFERGGRSFLVSTHRQESSNWVRNLRTAGEGVLTRGWSHQAIKVVELPADEAGRVLKEVLGPRLASPVGGFVLRRTFQVPPDAPLEDFISAARSHPVFELVSPGAEGLTSRPSIP